MMRGTAVSGGQQRRATWNTFAGIPWQVGDKRCYLPRFCGNTVAGGQQGDATWHAFAGIPWQVRGGEMLPGTLLRGFRARWAAGRCHLEHFCGDSVPGGRQRRTPDTLLRGFRARWAAEKDTWHAFAGIPCQVGGGKGYLERFCGDTVAGGRRERLPETLLRENRGRWAAGRCHLEHFCGDSVPGGRRGDATWNTFAGIPCQVDGGKGHLTRFRGNTLLLCQMENFIGI